jgi:hypothetical protein
VPELQRKLWRHPLAALAALALGTLLAWSAWRLSLDRPRTGTADAVLVLAPVGGTAAGGGHPAAGLSAGWA